MTRRHGTDAALDPVDYICITPDHLALGKNIPDGQGTLTLNGRQWAYCSAGLTNAPHAWMETGGVSFASIHHADLPVAPRPS